MNIEQYGADAGQVELMKRAMARKAPMVGPSQPSPITKERGNTMANGGQTIEGSYDLGDQRGTGKKGAQDLGQ